MSLLSATGCVDKPACGDFPLTPQVRECMAETVHEMVMEHYPFAEQKGLDLRTFSSTLSRLVELDLEDQDFIVELARAVGTLKDGHTRIERFSLGADEGMPPLDYRIDDEKVFITAVYDTALPIRSGDQILAIEGQAPLDYLRRKAALYEVEFSKLGQMHGPSGLLNGPADSTLTLRIAGRGEVQMRRRYHLPEPVSQRFGDIGYLNVRTFGYIDDLERLDKELNSLMDTSALIIDLRGNGGGYPSVTDGLFGRLIDEDVPGFDMVDVRGKLKRTMHSKPRGQTYDKPVVVLTNPRTYSASNYFAQRIVYHQRGVLIGERTGGGSASPEEGTLLVPGVWFQVSTYVVQTPEGINAEEGIEPDIPVDHGEAASQRETSVLGITVTDPALFEALRYLEENQ